VKKIKLTQGKLALVDDDWFEILNCHSWFYHCGYARRWSNFVDGKRHCIHMSRVIIGIDGLDFKEKEADHVDRNRLNNQKCNLRAVTRSLNLKNKSKYFNNTTNFKGVSYRKPEKKYRARIQCDGKTHYLGSFDDPKVAAIAYNKKATEVFGNFAFLNQI